MKKHDVEKIKKIYDYLVSSCVVDPGKVDGAFVFCRVDKLLAQKVAELADRNLINWVLFTGGIGKDSGVLTELEMPEAIYQAALLRWKHEVKNIKILVEPKASNGGENSRFGIDALIKEGVIGFNIIMVAHPTSIKRLYAAHQYIAEKEKNFFANYQLVASDYNFDPTNLIDQKESVAELLRLADWPAKGWAMPQSDLPMDLVDCVRETL